MRQFASRNAQWFLRQSVTKMRWIGIGLILIGTGLLVTRA
jgi:multidrug transporter EmrE-like cation transporter